VNPRLPISRGAFVVAQISGGEEEVPHAYVKRFVSQDSRRLRLEQYNPKKIPRIPYLEGRVGPPHHHERGE